MRLPDWIRDARDRRFQMAVAALLLIGLTYLGGRYVHQSRADLATLEDRLESLRVQNGVARSLLGSGVAEIAEDSIALYRERLRVVERLVPSSEEVPELLDAIANQARASAVELNFLQPIDMVPEADYSRRVYAVGVLGGYHDIGEFLTSIASLPRIVTPADLTLVPTGEIDASGTPMLDARFIIDTYVTSNLSANAFQNP